MSARVKSLPPLQICIARAIIRNPAIILLDEATTALDTNSGRQVQDALANVRKHKQITTISIAHRLSTILGCDQVAVISDGGIAELGSHLELLKKGGIYATLCEAQGIDLNSTFDTVAGTAENVAAQGNIVQTPDIETGLPEESAKRKEVVSVDGGASSDVDNVYSRLWKLNRSKWGFLALGTIGACIVGAIPPTEGILTARLVANLYAAGEADLVTINFRLSLYFLLLGGASLIGNILSETGFLVPAIVSQEE